MSGPSGTDVLKEAAKMMSEYLLETEGLSHLTADELLVQLEISRMAITGVIGTSVFLMQDGMDFCKSLGFDVGLAVRKPDGTEFIFYPAKNFGPNSVQVSPRLAKQELPPATPIASIPGVLPPSLSALPFASTRRPIGFIQQFLHPTPKAETADQETNPFPGINEYEDLL